MKRTRFSGENEVKRSTLNDKQGKKRTHTGVEKEMKWSTFKEYFRNFSEVSPYEDMPSAECSTCGNVSTSGGVQWVADNWDIIKHCSICKCAHETL